MQEDDDGDDDDDDDGDDDGDDDDDDDDDDGDDGDDSDGGDDDGDDDDDGGNDDDDDDDDDDDGDDNDDGDNNDYDDYYDDAQETALPLKQLKSYSKELLREYTLYVEAMWIKFKMDGTLHIQPHFSVLLVVHLMLETGNEIPDRWTDRLR